MTTTTVMKNSMSMTNAAETAGFTTVQNASAPTDSMDYAESVTGAWTGKEGEKTMWDDEDVMYYNRLLKEGYWDDEIVMNRRSQDDDMDSDLDDWDSDDYLWN